MRKRDIPGLALVGAVNIVLALFRLSLPRWKVILPGLAGFIFGWWLTSILSFNEPWVKLLCSGVLALSFIKKGREMLDDLFP